MEDRRMAEKVGFLSRRLQGERPPLASLAGLWDVELAREVGRSVDEIDKRTSKGVMMWMNLSSKVSRGGERERSGEADMHRPTRNSQAETHSARSKRTSRRNCKTGKSRSGGKSRLRGWVGLRVKKGR
jgi:hypothetical protein